MERPGVGRARAGGRGAGRRGAGPEGAGPEGAGGRGAGRRGAGRAALAAAVLAASVIAAAGCSPVYVLRAGWEEARILAARRPIHQVVHDTTISPEVRWKLRLVQDARDFADRTLGLEPRESFRSYASVPSDTLVLVVTAAEEFALRWKTWWWPIVGRLPYKGFFDFGEAVEQARRLRNQGYDVNVRPSSAFSSLGWFPDPVLSTTLRMDSVSLVETVVHEITHTTFFPPGQARFNESFANFVGNRGAIAFFCGPLRHPEGCRRARDAWHDTRVFGRFFGSVVEPLEELYARRDLSPEEMRRRKRAVFRAAAERFEEQVRPQLRGRWGRLDPEGLDNAWVLARLLYYTRLDDFQRVYEAHEELRPAVEAIIAAARAHGPWTGLDSLLVPRALTRAPE